VDQVAVVVEAHGIAVGVAAEVDLGGGHEPGSSPITLALRRLNISFRESWVVRWQSSHHLLPGRRGLASQV
jgi:hypothetical protein